ncbi:hypothetical protein AC229_1115 [Oenococcus oeni]|nr:hypothetical protein AC229_1115 [Oenococcus oeni]
MFLLEALSRSSSSNNIFSQSEPISVLGEILKKTKKIHL